MAQLRRLDDAASLYQGLLDEAPQDAKLLSGLAQIRRRQGDIEAALTLFRAAAAARTSNCSSR